MHKTVRNAESSEKNILNFVSECSMNDFITVTCLHVSARDYSNSINSSLGLPKFTFVMTYSAIECHLALEEYGLGPND
ncbi:hypothetical protein BLOT_007481 [Blomia tropicalis]|nr:hypothetical protein BLOT_007481 [Blomia tropicalis]